MRDNFYHLVDREGGEEEGERILSASSVAREKNISSLRNVFN